MSDKDFVQYLSVFGSDLARVQPGFSLIDAEKVLARSVFSTCVILYITAK